ncbi:MAG TPA: HAMP domain-containing sensor histidine kinase [Acetobacteraceae bacterium]
MYPEVLAWFLFLIAATALAVHAWSLRKSLAASAVMRDRALTAEHTATRLLRLAAHELRSTGMSLQGHAEQLAGHQLADAMGIAAASAQILGIADELQDNATPATASRILREEVIELGSMLHEAVGAAAAALEPGRRNWRIAEAPPQALWADRRALRHILGRVLADAARNTRHDDWIELAIRPHADGVALVVEDEGAGLATPAPGIESPARTDSRGIGLRLTLARSLMHAHGGRLEVEALARVGSRVTLVFPAARLRPAKAVVKFSLPAAFSA